MPWLYSSSSILAPPKTFDVPDPKLRLEIALLEFHLWFMKGSKAEKMKLAALRAAVFEHLDSGGANALPVSYYEWLYSIYTCQERFSSTSGNDVERYRRGVTVEDWNYWLVGIPGRYRLIPFIAKIKDSHLYVHKNNGPHPCFIFLDTVFNANLGELKSIYLTPAERKEGIEDARCQHLKDLSPKRFQDKEWFDDEIVNYYGKLCSEDSGELVVSSLFFQQLGEYYSTNWRKLLSVVGTLSERISSKGIPKTREKTAEAKIQQFKNYWKQKGVATFPIYWGKNHWLVVRANRSKLSWEVRDSIVDKQATLEIIQKLRLFFENTLSIECAGWTILQFTQSQQNNFYDCGVYACQSIKHGAFQVPLPEWNNYDCQDFRIMMYLELVEWKIRWKDDFGSK